MFGAFDLKLGSAKGEKKKGLDEWISSAIEKKETPRAGPGGKEKGRQTVSQCAGGEQRGGKKKKEGLDSSYDDKRKKGTGRYLETPIAGRRWGPTPTLLLAPLRAEAVSLEEENGFVFLSF